MRYTKFVNGHYVLIESENDDENNILINAVSCLARYENFFEELINDSERIPLELVALKEKGKERTVAFKELMTKKLIVANILSKLKAHGINAN